MAIWQWVKLGATITTMAGSISISLDTMHPNVLYRNNGDGSFVESELTSIVSLPETISGGAV